MFRKILHYLGCLIFAVLALLAINYVIGLIIGPRRLTIIIISIIMFALVIVYIVRNILRKKYEKFLLPIFTILADYDVDFDKTIDTIQSFNGANREVGNKITNEIIFNKSIIFITFDDATSLDNLINKEKTLENDDREFFSSQVLRIFLPQILLLRLMIPFSPGKNFIDEYIISPSSPVAALRKLTADFGIPEKFDLIFSQTHDLAQVQQQAKKLYDFAGPEIAKCLGPKYGQSSDQLKNLLGQARDMGAFNEKFDQMAAYFTNFSEGDCLPRWLFLSDGAPGLSNLEFIFEALWLYAFQQAHDPTRFDQAAGLFSRAFSLAIQDCFGQIKSLAPLDLLLATIKSLEKQGLDLDDGLVTDLRRLVDYFITQKNSAALTSLASGLKWLNQAQHESELISQMEKFKLALKPEL
ncbi:MAG: hypothetical protein LBE80_05595 [Deltaproteobacteria bacterium]|jgi:hypothetical protein|nr:hypothetical protein [Deltaproteobacteria bacterium]